MNLFNFEYEQEKINNKNGTESRFGIVYGQDGNVIHTKKDSYNIIHTADISELGQRFIEKDYKVSTFVDKSGETIGLNISLGQRLSVVGDKAYNAIITIPNNGVGKGFLSIKEVRLVCTNGMVRNVNGGINSSIKIPHTINYAWSIKTMQESLEAFTSMLDSIEAADQALDKNKLERTEVMYHLNKWFFEHEYPKTQMPEKYTFEKFRQDLYENPEGIKCIDRHKQLMAAFNKESGYNEELNLDLSMYTVFATVTNYLSRRIEKSRADAPEEILYQRAASKLEYFEIV